MKVKLNHSTDGNDCARLSMSINDKKAFRIGCLSECPEDAMLERDLSFVYDIRSWIEMAYKAGENGEELHIEEIDDED